MKFTYTILIMFWLSGFSQPVAQTCIRSDFQRILIINSFDAQAMKARKNKKLLFSELVDSLKKMLNFDLSDIANSEIIVVPGLVIGNDSVYFSVMREHSAKKAVVIKNLDAYFLQTGVEVTKDGNHKDRVASYNIVADVEYILYNDSTRLKEFPIQVSEFFTERDVISGLLAAGPDIVGKRKHAFKIVRKNSGQFGREVEFFLEELTGRQSDI